MTIKYNANQIVEEEINALRSVQNKCYNASVDAGWHSKPVEFGTRIALIHGELSETLEAYRKNLMDEHLPHRRGIEVELSDAVIRIFDAAGKEGLDLASAIAEKLEYNRTREDHKIENRNKENGKKF